MTTNGASATRIGITLHSWASKERKEGQLMLGWISCGDYYHILVSGMKACTPVKLDRREYYVCVCIHIGWLLHSLDGIKYSTVRTYTDRC
jgi:hypothetical protein